MFVSRIFFNIYIPERELVTKEKIKEDNNKEGENTKRYLDESK